jgi:hypothetical protein
MDGVTVVLVESENEDCNVPLDRTDNDEETMDPFGEGDLAKNSDL